MPKLFSRVGTKSTGVACEELPNEKSQFGKATENQFPFGTDEKPQLFGRVEHRMSLAPIEILVSLVNRGENEA
jgi:hypothetical protein